MRRVRIKDKESDSLSLRKSPGKNPARKTGQFKVERTIHRFQGMEEDFKRLFDDYKETKKPFSRTFSANFESKICTTKCPEPNAFALAI